MLPAPLSTRGHLRHPPHAQYTGISAELQGCRRPLSILRPSRNPDAAYYGKTVGPKDTHKVLFRWKLDDGRYRVLYGDLRFETITADRLRTLEAASPGRG
jgi:hypothetical protein